jgi:K+/H+ antiporter YhaU regulatory subunit KhtT
VLAVATVVVAVLVSLLIARVATVAFVLTGLSRDAARFQARSALSGTGFTTSEAEGVVDHPVRRRIVMALMLVGSAGLVTVVASVAISFAGADRGQAEVRVAVLIGALLVLFLLSRSSWVDRHLSKAIALLLQRFTDLEARDYGALLHLAEHYAVGELMIREGDWVADRTLDELELREEGVVVLGVNLADGTWVGAPTFETRLAAGDKILVYGPGARLSELDGRQRGREGDAAHDRAAAEHTELVERAEREHGP